MRATARQKRPSGATKTLSNTGAMGLNVVKISVTARSGARPMTSSNNAKRSISLAQKSSGSFTAPGPAWT